MQITVFGASGQVGRQVVKLALDRGHNVVAFVHSHNPLGEAANLNVLTGDVHDSLAVAEALKDSQAVISTLGSWHTKDKDIVSSGAKIIVAAMESQGLSRLISLTGTAAVYSKDHLSLLDGLSHSFLGLVAPKILKDGEEHLKVLEASQLDWTCVRSPAMNNASYSTYRFDTKLAPLWATISRTAVATSLVDLAESSAYSKQAPVIYRLKA